MNSWYICLVFVVALFVTDLSMALEVDGDSDIETIKQALSKGRKANIRGSEYLWEGGVIYKIKNGEKRRTRGIKDIVKASVSPMITTVIPVSSNCDKPDFRQSRSLELIKKAMQLFPTAKYEYSTYQGKGVDRKCVTIVSDEIVRLLHRGEEGVQLTKSKVSPRGVRTKSSDEEFVLQILRIN